MKRKKKNQTLYDMASILVAIGLKRFNCSKRSNIQYTK